MLYLKHIRMANKTIDMSKIRLLLRLHSQGYGKKTISAQTVMHIEHKAGDKLFIDSPVISFRLQIPTVVRP